jgi:hypothetical protein
MTLRELLLERKAALCERWLDATLAEYGEVTALRWRRERDPFANPVGHALATGLPDLFDAVVGEGDPAPAAVRALESILRIRSVQDLTPSRAVGFVYLLREGIRGELERELAGGGHAAELASIEGRIERLAFLGFDAYVRFRVQMFRLRQEELKRSVATLLRRWNGSSSPEDASARPCAGGEGCALPEPEGGVVRLAGPSAPGVAR